MVIVKDHVKMLKTYLSILYTDASSSSFGFDFNFFSGRYEILKDILDQLLILKVNDSEKTVNQSRLHLLN